MWLLHPWGPQTEGGGQGQVPACSGVLFKTLLKRMGVRHWYCLHNIDLDSHKVTLLTDRTPCKELASGI